MKLSVVIVSYNVKDLLLQCLSSLYADLPAERLQVIVADNASRDGSVQAVKEKFPQAQLIANDHNAGFSGGNNQGLEICTGEFILLLNPDTEIKSGALQAMIDRLSQEKEIAVLGPRLLNSDGSLQISAWKLPGLGAMLAEAFFLHKVFPAGSYDAAQFEKEFAPGFLSGAALLFSAETLKKAGKLDANLFWMEDVDFCRRVQEQGGKTIYFPGASIVHHSGQSAKKNYKVAIANQLISKLKYFRKHSGGPAFFLASVFVFLQIVIRLLALLPASLLGESFRARFAAYLYTFKKFFTYLSGDKSLT